jgi:cell wall-associated NlpC family hydrolase
MKKKIPHPALFVLGAGFVFLAIFCLSACGKSKPLWKIPTVAPGDERQVEIHLRREAEKWLGTPHRLGGNDPTGIDCSGLVTAVYRALFDVRLPRTTKEQIRIGRPVDEQETAPGDLLFFMLPFRTRHVGIYLGSGEFLHASKSQGVTIARIDNEYWHRHFSQARRILLFEYK